MSDFSRSAPGEIGKADPKELKNWQIDRTDSVQNNYRCAQVRTWELNRLYSQLNQQWLEPALMGLMAGDGTYTINPFFEPMLDGQSWQARPVQNELISILQNEVARLIAGGTDFRVIRQERSTRIEKAAKLGAAWLEADNEEIGWKNLERNLVADMAMCGTGIIRTGQLTDWEDTIATPLDVLGCPGCRWIALQNTHKDGVIKGKGAFDVVSKFGGTPQNFRLPEYGGRQSLTPVFDEQSPGLEGQEPIANLDRCPMCGTKDLIPRAPLSDETEDYAGDPTSKETPKSDIETSILSPYDWFPSGNGRVDPDRKVYAWHRESIVSLDWVSKHFEKGYKVRPDETLDQIAMWHPHGIEDGRPALQTSNKRDLANHCVLRESVRGPYFEQDKDDPDKRIRHDKGRWTVSAGSEILIDDDLMIRDDRSGRLIPRVEVNACQWEPLKGSIWGAALLTFCRSMQDDINTAKAQAIEARHAHGNPKWMLPPGTSIEYAGFGAGGSYQNDVLRFFGNKDPIQIKGMGLDEQWRYEMQLNQEALQRAGQTRDVETGDAPAGVTAASALQLLADKASVTRGARIDSKRMAIQFSLSHRLSLAGVLFVTERDFKASERGDRESIKSFIGTDLEGQFDVEVKTIPFVESPILRREAAAEAVKNSYLILRTAGDRERFLESQGVPSDIAPGEGIQIDNAKDEWLKYVEISDTPEGESPAQYIEAPIVKDYDDNAIHSAQHLEDEQSSEGEQMRENENEIAQLTYGWKEDYERLKQGEMALKLMPPGDKPEDAPAGLDGLPDPKLAAANAKKFLAMKALEAELKTLPRLPELRIERLKLTMLEKAGYRGTETPPGPTPGDLALIRWQSHRNAHDDAEAMKIAAMSQPAQGAAPAAGPGPSMAPSPQQPMPAPGAPPA